MSVKSSISLSDQQDAFARELVAQGRYSSMSAVIQNSLDLLRQKTEAEAAQITALQALLHERQAGPFRTASEMQSGVAAMIARKRRDTSVDG